MKKTLFVSLLALTLASATAQAQNATIEGRVMLNDSVPASFATIYFPSLGKGCITNNEGLYSMSELPSGRIVAEFSTLGYETQQFELNTSNTSTLKHDVMLHEQPILLSEVYVTPNGEDPATYILRQVAKRSKENEKRLVSYRATMKGKATARDLDIVPAIMPKAFMRIMHGALRVAGINNLFNHFFENPKVDAEYTLVKGKKNGKEISEPLQVYNDTPAMNQKAKDGLDKIMSRDVFDDIYGSNTDWSEKKLSKNNWKLKGVIEENGLTIDVLKLENIKNDSVIQTRTLYVVEEAWGILRVENKTSFSESCTECRNIGGDIYLPISFVSKPMKLSVRQMWEDMEQKSKAEGKEIEDNKMTRRVRAVCTGPRNYEPYAVFPYTIEYSNVEIK